MWYYKHTKENPELNNWVDYVGCSPIPEPYPPTTKAHRPTTIMRVSTVGPGSSSYEPNKQDKGKFLPSGPTQGTRSQIAGPGTNNYQPNKQDIGKFAPSGHIQSSARSGKPWPSLLLSTLRAFLFSSPS